MSDANDFGFGDLELDTAVAAQPAATANKDEDEGGATGSTGGSMAAAMPQENPGELLGDIKSSIEQMQSQMQNTYQKLNSTRLTGESNDGRVKLTMTATYVFEDIEMGEEALEGGVTELKWRIKEAFRDLLKKIQDRTQEQTMSLLQNMDIPDEIKNMDGAQ